MSYDADDDCLNCGLSLPSDDGTSTRRMPFCDDRCERAFEESRALRRMRRDLLLWNARCRWSALVGRFR